MDETPNEKALPEDTIEAEFDNESVSQNEQIPTADNQEKLDETPNEKALSTIEASNQKAALTPSEDTFLPAEQKTIIHFKHDSIQLSDEACEVLDQIVDFGSSNQVLNIIIFGYSDSLGQLVYNKNLSKMRAEVVKKYLIDKGIPVEKIKTFAMGSENPIASNETFEGRKLNRRIEIRFKVK